MSTLYGEMVKLRSAYSTSSTSISLRTVTFDSNPGIWPSLHPSRILNTAGRRIMSGEVDHGLLTVKGIHQLPELG